MSIPQQIALLVVLSCLVFGAIFGGLYLLSPDEPREPAELKEILNCTKLEIPQVDISWAYACDFNRNDTVDIALVDRRITDALTGTERGFYEASNALVCLEAADTQEIVVDYISLSAFKSNVVLKTQIGGEYDNAFIKQQLDDLGYEYEERAFCPQD